jgi:hypothetical protein
MEVDLGLSGEGENSRKRVDDVTDVSTVLEVAVRTRESSKVRMSQGRQPIQELLMLVGFPVREFHKDLRDPRESRCSTHGGLDSWFVAPDFRSM